MAKQKAKDRTKDRIAHREQQDDQPKPGSVDYILAMAQREAEKLDIARAAFHQQLLSFGDYHRLTVSITDNVAKITRLARDMQGAYASLGDIHVSLNVAPQMAVPHEDGSVDLMPMDAITFNGKPYYQFTDDDGIIKLLPITKEGPDGKADEATE